MYKFQYTTVFIKKYKIKKELKLKKKRLDLYKWTINQNNKTDSLSIIFWLILFKVNNLRKNQI